MFWWEIRLRDTASLLSPCWKPPRKAKAGREDRRQAGKPALPHGERSFVPSKLRSPISVKTERNQKRKSGNKAVRKRAPFSARKIERNTGDEEAKEHRKRNTQNVG
jgi:hypothetical protein